MADYGNDERVEVLWAIKAMEHAEVYFNVRIFLMPNKTQEYIGILI